MALAGLYKAEGAAVDISAADADDIDLNSESFRPEIINDDNTAEAVSEDVTEPEPPAEPKKSNESGADTNE